MFDDIETWFDEIIKDEHPENRRSRATVLSDKYILKRATSELKLLEILGCNIEPGYQYHVVSSGDVDSLSFLKVILNQQDLDYCLFSTWCMVAEDIIQLDEWLDAGKIKKLDAYVGEIFPGSYSHAYGLLSKVVKKCNGRVCVFRNHSKVYAGTGSKFDFAIASSTNINTNPRAKNTSIMTGSQIYNFYKEYFDGIKSFNRDFDEWQPYNV